MRLNPLRPSVAFSQSTCFTHARQQMKKISNKSEAKFWKKLFFYIRCLGLNVLRHFLSITKVFAEIVVIFQYIKSNLQQAMTAAYFLKDRAIQKYRSLKADIILKLSLREYSCQSSTRQHAPV